LSYCYFLVRLKEPFVGSLKNFSSEKCVEETGDNIEDVKNRIVSEYPDWNWCEWEWVTVRYREGPRQVLFSQILDMPGRFEITISDYTFLHVNIDGSHNIDQKELVIRIAKRIGMSVFDVQSGERIYLQET
jgi:hypothetical protein